MSDLFIEISNHLRTIYDDIFIVPTNKVNMDYPRFPCVTISTKSTSSLTNYSVFTRTNVAMREKFTIYIYDNSENGDEVVEEIATEIVKVLTKLNYELNENAEVPNIDETIYRRVVRCDKIIGG